MGDWGGAPPGWVPPEERREQEAAAEAAEVMASRRAAADAQTEAMVSAIRDGFSVLADAILVASGATSHERDAFFTMPGEPAPSLHICEAPEAFVGGPPIDHDDGIDGILDEHTCNPAGGAEMGASFGTRWACSCGKHWMWIADPASDTAPPAGYWELVSHPVEADPVDEIAKVWHKCDPPAVPSADTLGDITVWTCPDCAAAYQWQGKINPDGRAVWVKLSNGI